MDRQEFKYDHVSKIFFAVKKPESYWLQLHNSKRRGNDDSVIYNNFFSQDVCDTCSLSKSLLKDALLRVSEKV